MSDDIRPEIAVVCTAFKRPDYSRQSLNALAVALEALGRDVPIHLHVEPGSDEVMALCEAFCRRFHGGTTLVRNRERLGVNANTLAAINAGFARGDVDYVCLIEDDVVLAADGLTFLAWAAAQFWDDTRVLSATTYNREPAMPPPERWHEVRTRAWTHVWGFGIWRSRWAMIRNQVGRGRMSWDCDVNAARERAGLREAFPVLSRCNNVGVLSSAAHVNSPPPEFYAEWHVLKFHAGQVDVPLGEFRLANEVRA